MLAVNGVIYAPYCRKCGKEIEKPDTMIMCPICFWIFHASRCYIRHDTNREFPDPLDCEYSKTPGPANGSDLILPQIIDEEVPETIREIEVNWS